MTWQNASPLLIYPKLIPHVIKLCWKHKAGISIISKSNPAFPYGGLPFASKKEMFDLFKDREEFLPYILIRLNQKLEQKLEKAEEFARKVSYPLIAKPDSSHRGIDIHMIKDRLDLMKLIKSQKWDYILQEYCDYDYEYGVFYCRKPNQKKGTIISLSKKEVPVIYGNGTDNLKTLILNSEIDNKKPLIKKYAQYEDLVIPYGEKRNLLVCASHAQGGIYRDAKELLTEELITETDRICKIEGFCFGRLDVRAKSPEEFKKGNYRIIEVNGATSEFIHIYDIKYSLEYGIEELKRQWDTLFEVSVQNRDKSRNSLSFYKFIKEYINFFLLTKKVTGKLW